MAHSRILLIEDSPTYSKLARLLLSASGHEVTCAATAEDGLRIARESVPDLILLDINLPDSDGFTAVKRLREDPRSQGIVTIGLTADRIWGEEERQEARSAGFDEYFEKPFTEAAFRSLIAPFVGAGEEP